MCPQSVWKATVDLCVLEGDFYLPRLYIGDKDNLTISSRFLTRLSLSDAGM